MSVLERDHTFGAMDNSSAGLANLEFADQLQAISNKEADDGKPLDESSSLDILPTMPLDILYEIFGWADPIDLLHLARTSKSLRGLLMNRDSAFLWKFTLKHHPTVPVCPSGVAEPLWVDLIFSPFNCHICGEGDALPDLALWTRLCQKCMDKELVYRNYGSHRGRYNQSGAWNLVPYTVRRWSNVYHTESAPRYRLSELQDTGKRLAAYKKEIKLGRPGAKEALEEFVAIKEKLVHSAIDCRGKYREWANALAYDHEDRQRQRSKELEDGFVELGHNRDDVKLFLWNYPQRFPQGHHQKTLSGWDTVKPVIEPQLLEWLRSCLIRSRGDFIWNLYEEYQKSIAPAQWEYRPPNNEVRVHRPLARLIHAPSNASLGEAEKREATSIFPSFIAEWMSRKRQELQTRLPSHDLPDTAQPSPAEIGSGGADVRNVDLATSVFLCPNALEEYAAHKDCSRPLIAWENAGPHLCCYAASSLRFSQRGYDAAASLISLVGLDPRITLPSHLDELDSRFLCSNCPIKQYRGVMGHKAFAWRDCVAHFIETEKSNPEAHILPNWLLLTPEATADVCRREGGDPTFEDKTWFCNRCPTHSDVLVKRSEIVRHLWTEHQIARPKSGQDLIYLRPLRNPRRPVGFAESPPAEYRCNRCPPTSNRLFKLRDIKRHLPDRHQVKEYLLDEDYSKIQTILRSSTVGPEDQLQSSIVNPTAQK